MTTQPSFDGMAPLPDAEVARRPAESPAARATRLIAAGLHPLTGARLREPSGESCGSCAHIRRLSRGNTWFKCPLNATGSPSTDVRLHWPACRHWMERPAGRGKGTIETIHLPH